MRASREVPKLQSKTYQSRDHFKRMRKTNVVHAKVKGRTLYKKNANSSPNSQLNNLMPSQDNLAGYGRHKKNNFRYVTRDAPASKPTLKDLKKKYTNFDIDTYSNNLQTNKYDLLYFEIKKIECNLFRIRLRLKNFFALTLHSN